MVIIVQTFICFYSDYPPSQRWVLLNIQLATIADAFMFNTCCPTIERSYMSFLELVSKKKKDNSKLDSNDWFGPIRENWVNFNNLRSQRTRIFSYPQSGLAYKNTHIQAMDFDSIKWIKIKLLWSLCNSFLCLCVSIPFLPYPNPIYQLNGISISIRQLNVSLNNDETIASEMFHELKALTDN